MLPLQFAGQNIHFAINLFAALVFFAVFWLYFDAWMSKRARKELLLWTSFLLVALSFLVNATIVEYSVLGTSLLGDITQTITLILRGIGYAGIFIGQLLDPLQQIPKTDGIDPSQFQRSDDGPAPASAETAPAAKTTKSAHVTKRPAVHKKLQSVGFVGAGSLSQLVVPFGALAVAYMYWRRATTGLERHYRPVALAFALLFVFDTLALARLWRDSTNPYIENLAASFGPIWIAEQVFLLAGALLLGRWVWGYLTRRFMSQLFMIFTALTLAIFLLTTISFTFLLVNNIRNASLENLQTAAGVLNYAINGKKSETQAKTQTVAENPLVASAVRAGNNRELAALTATFLKDKKLSSLIITSDSGQVLLRAEDPDRFGDSLSSDTLVRRALIGQPATTVTTREGVLAPAIYIKSAAPIRASDGTIVGTAVASLAADNAFVDGIKRDTGLESAIYAGSVRSATSLLTPGGKSRWVGIKMDDKDVLNTVLKQKRTYKGSVDIQNRQYLAVYAPLKDVDNSVIGMLFIGEPQVSILRAAGRSVEMTFIVSALLLILTIIPAYLVAKYLTYQLE